MNSMPKKIVTNFFYLWQQCFEGVNVLSPITPLNDSQTKHFKSLFCNLQTSFQTPYQILQLDII